MTTDLWMLVWTAVLTLLVPVTYAAARLGTQGGNVWAFGNREAPLPGVPAWGERAVRAHLNLVENLAPFAILVLVAHVAGLGNATTALGATIFFWGRVAHLAIYIAGIVYLRTVAFAAALVGEIMILTQLL